MQDVADEIGVQQPVTVIGNTSEEAVKLLRAASREGRRLYRRAPWSVLVREHSITTANGTPDYALPSDYDRHTDNTAWDTTNYWKMRGSLSPSAWQWRKNAISAAAVNRRVFRVKFDTVTKTRRVFIDPTPTSADSLVIEYISNEWCEDASQVGQSDWALDTDVPRLDNDLIEMGTIWRYLKAIGMAYADEFNDYKTAVLERIAHDVPSNTVNMGEAHFTFANLPEGNFGL